MKSDNFRLIAEVAKRRCLWDTNMSMAYRKEDGAAQWAIVAEILQQDVVTCKKRFKGLRDSYRAEIRKIQQKRMEMSHWTYFRSLEFMRHIFDPERLVPFPPEAYDLDAEQPEDDCDTTTRLVDFAIDVDLDDDDSVDFEIIGDIFKRESSLPQDSGSDGGSLIKPLDSSTAHLSDHEPSPRLISCPPMHLHLKPPTKRVRRRKPSSLYDVSSSNGKATSNHPAEADLKNDSDYSFMVSMVPHVKTLSPIGNLKFRMEMARILVELRKEDQQAPQGMAAGAGAVGLPRLTPAPDSSFTSQLDNCQPYCISNSSYLNGSPQSPSSYDYVDSSMIECDVKIENEALI
ncbi:uncharacterized protein LOC108148062 [Drosophila elegans]|uniref:uncharacterized protein LOC108148062 n=1 Tax=Drosophila elegans TaxID=30023 RepID=UPI0007E646EB|nr:uncharacterized protein LOC108148062 [Drosophila elegans]